MYFPRTFCLENRTGYVRRKSYHKCRSSFVISFRSCFANGTNCLLCFDCITIPPSRLRRATSLYTREAFVRCVTVRQIQVCLTDYTIICCCFQWYIADAIWYTALPYDILATQAWYNIRSFICRKHISSLEERYHIEDISPVPTGTDIIEKSHLCQ